MPRKNLTLFRRDLVASNEGDFPFDLGDREGRLWQQLDPQTGEEIGKFAQLAGIVAGQHHPLPKSG